MKNIVLSCAIVLSSSVMWAAEGSSSGGDGGHGVICRDAVGNIESVRTLDLFEASHRYAVEGDFGVTSNRDADVQKGINEAGRRLLEVFPPSHSVHYVILAAHRLRLTRENSLPYPTLDMGLAPDLKRTCSYTQIARRYTSSNGIDVVSLNPAWASMLTGNELTALWLHEAFHNQFLTLIDTSAVRQAVIYLSAPKTFRDINKNAFKKLISTGTALNWDEYR